MSITVHVNGTVQFTFFLVMNLYLLIVILILVILFSSFKLENGLKKHVQNVVRKKYGVVELVVILFTFNIKFQPLFLSISWRKPLWQSFLVFDHFMRLWSYEDLNDLMVSLLKWCHFLEWTYIICQLWLKV